MKKLALLLLATLTFSVAQASNEPTLILEVQFKDRVEVNKIKSLENDTNLCCLFDITIKSSTDNITRVIHKETGIVLGTFYGTPSKQFLMEIYQTHLTPKYINFIIPKLVTLNLAKE
jgi:hypothetical protein